MPSFGGAAIFGIDVEMKTQQAPRATVRVGFFGLSGLFQLDGGGRGGQTTVKGKLVGVDRPTLDSYVNTLKSYADNVARVLVDTGGASWPNVVLDQVSLDPERYYYNVSDGVYECPYQAVFTHLT